MTELGEKKAGTEVATIEFSGAVKYIPDAQADVRVFCVSDAEMNELVRNGHNYELEAGKTYEVRNRHWKMRVEPAIVGGETHVMLKYLDYPDMGDNELFQSDVLLGHQGLPSVTLREAGSFSLKVKEKNKQQVLQ